MNNWFINQNSSSGSSEDILVSSSDSEVEIETELGITSGDISAECGGSMIKKRRKQNKYIIVPPVNTPNDERAIRRFSIDYIRTGETTESENSDQNTIDNATITDNKMHLSFIISNKIGNNITYDPIEHFSTLDFIERGYACVVISDNDNHYMLYTKQPMTTADKLTIAITNNAILQFNLYSEINKYLPIYIAYYGDHICAGDLEARFPAIYSAILGASNEQAHGKYDKYVKYVI